MDLGRVIVRGLIELAISSHGNLWQNGLKNDEDRKIIELGGAFVDPSYSRCGVWTQMLKHRLAVVRNMESITISVT